MADELRAWDSERAFLELLPARLEAADVRAISDPAGLAHSIRDSVDKVAGAETAACIGVVGEFRTGKSSLINAMAGGDVALVDIVETTAVACRYDHGPHRGAVVHFTSGESEQLTIEAVNRRLAERRHDQPYLSTIDHVEFRAPLAGLVGIELWDAPGFGGSDFNEATAHRFIERITGALWVLDATLLGTGAIAAPLQRLNVAGKRVVAVLNQVDRLESPAEVEEAIDYVRETYGSWIADVVPFSAKAALAAIKANREDPALAHLRVVTLDKLISRSASDRHTRIGAAVATSADECRRRVRDVRIHGQDVLGLLDHAEENLRNAASDLVNAVERMIGSETEAAFAVLERGQIERLRRKIVLPSRLGEFAGRLSLTEADVEEACRHLGSAESQRFVLDAVSGNIQTFLEVHWRRAVERSVNLAAIAQSRITLQGFRSPEGVDRDRALVAPSHAGGTPHGLSRVADDRSPSLLQEAKHALEAAGDGFLAIGGGGSVLAVLAVAVTTPLTIVALPALLSVAAGAGLVAGIGNAAHTVWKRASGEPVGVSLADAEDAVRAWSRELARSVSEHLSAAAQIAALKANLDTRITDAIAFATEQTLGGRSREQVRGSVADLRRLEDELASIAEGIRRNREILKGPSGSRPELPLVLSPGEQATRQFDEAVGDIADQLDVIVVGADRGLTRLLERLGPHGSARILVLGDASTAGPAEATAAFGNRELDLQARLVGHPAGSRLLDAAVLIITADEAFSMDRALVELGRAPVRLEHFKNGRTAAQRLFASLWSGTTERGEELDVSVLS